MMQYNGEFKHFKIVKCDLRFSNSVTLSAYLVYLKENSPLVHYTQKYLMKYIMKNTEFM